MRTYYLLHRDPGWIAVFTEAHCKRCTSCNSSGPSAGTRECAQNSTACPSIPSPVVEMKRWRWRSKSRSQNPRSPSPRPSPQGEGETFSGFGDDQSATFLSTARDRSLSWAVTIQLDWVAQPNLAVLGGNLPPSLERRTRSPFCAALVVYFINTHTFRCPQSGPWRGAREGVYPQRYSTDRATKPQANFSATLRAAVLFRSDVVARSLQTHAGYARRSRLV